MNMVKKIKSGPIYPHSPPPTQRQQIQCGGNNNSGLFYYNRINDEE
jgi:hypothetical protein